MSKYKPQKAGEWEFLNAGKEYLQVACCDCGLVHLHDFRIVGRRIRYRTFRDRRATAQLRRHGNLELFRKNQTPYRIVRRKTTE